MPTTARLAWCTAKRRTLPQGANVPYRREVGRRGADLGLTRLGAEPENMYAGHAVCQRDSRQQIFGDKVARLWSGRHIPLRPLAAVIVRAVAVMTCFMAWSRGLEGLQ